jgi:hypothetical protein
MIGNIKFSNVRCLVALIVVCSTTVSAQAQRVSSSECRELLTSLADASTQIFTYDDPIVLYEVPSDAPNVWPDGLEWAEVDLSGLRSLEQTSQSLGLRGDLIESSVCDFRADDGGDAACVFFLIREPQRIRNMNRSYKAVIEASFSGQCIAN